MGGEQRNHSNADSLDREEHKAVKLRSKLDGALTTYIKRVSVLGIVSELIVGSKKGEPPALFNVFNEDFSSASAQDHRYEKLRHIGTELRRTLADTAPIYVSAINPSKLERFLEQCKKRDVEIERLPVPIPQGTHR